jgi:uncharacterized protein (TIGR02145 family)
MKIIYFIFILFLFSCEVSQSEEPDKKDDEERILVEKYPVDSKFCSGSPTAIVEVMNPYTGNTWMDRNLGAKRAATNNKDEEAFGDLFQWGRRADGHQCRNSKTVRNQSFTNTPGHGDFIIGFRDWKNPVNFSLWQGVNGQNNPCPKGFRLPTTAEFRAELDSWFTFRDVPGPPSMKTPLKFTLTGLRSWANDGEFVNVGQIGNYWTSDVTNNLEENASRASIFNSEGFGSIGVVNLGERRANGLSIRCIKN